MVTTLSVLGGDQIYTQKDLLVLTSHTRTIVRLEGLGDLIKFTVVIICLSFKHTQSGTQEREFRSTANVPKSSCVSVAGEGLHF